MNKQSALRQIVRAAGITFVLGMVGYVFSAFFRIFFARYFGPEQLGFYDISLNVISMVILFAAIGTASSIPKYYAQYLVEKNYSMLNGFTAFTTYLPFAISLVFTAILYVFTPALLSHLNFSLDYVSLFRLLILIVPFRLLREQFGNILMARKDVFLPTFLESLLDKIILLGGVFYVYYTGAGLLTFMYFVIASTAVSFFSLWFYLARTHRDYASYSSSYDTKDWLSFSLPLLFSGVFFYILGWIDNFIIAIYLNPVSLGTYSTAFSLASYLFFIPGLFLTIFIPVLTDLRHAGPGRFAPVFERVKLWAFSIAAFVGGIFLVFSREILVLLFGTDFAAGSSSLIILTLGFLAVSYFVFYSSILTLEKKTMVQMWITLVFAAVNIVGNIVLISIFNSIWAVAISTSFCLAGSRVAEFFFARRYMPLPLDWITLVKIIVTIMVGVGVVKLALIYLNVAIASVYLKSAIALAIYLATVVLLVFGLKIPCDDDRAIVKDIFAYGANKLKRK